jgi:hypothetical protein
MYSPAPNPGLSVNEELFVGRGKRIKSGAQCSFMNIRFAGWFYEGCGENGKKSEIMLKFLMPFFYFLLT